MAPSTRSTRRDTTPDRLIRHREYDTVEKTRFFNAYDNRDQSQSERAFFDDSPIDRTTGRAWLRKRELLGDIAYRRDRPQSEILGRKEIIPPEQYQVLVSPSQNPVRDQLYEAQLEYHHLPISVRTLRRGLSRYTKQGRRYRQAYISKEVTAVQRRGRIQYCQMHDGKSIDDFWRRVIFADEMHFDPTSIGVGHILREAGTRYDTENIQTRPLPTGVKLHCAAWVSYDHKAPFLIFYNDEEEYTYQPRRQGRPRKSKYEDDAAFQRRIQEWQAEQPHQVVVKPKGNSMTQKYYVDNVLPHYIHAIQLLRLQDSQCWYLLEDNDPSHGTRTNGLATQLKTSNWVDSLPHPSNSPDLNAQESIWNILKQRVRKRQWTDLEQL
jgi:hypothetical protein